MSTLMGKPGNERWQLKRPSKKALRASSEGGRTLAAKAKYTLEGKTPKRTPRPKRPLPERKVLYAKTNR
jgi:hypothetical protein